MGTLFPTSLNLLVPAFPNPLEFILLQSSLPETGSMCAGLAFSSFNLDPRASFSFELLEFGFESQKLRILPDSIFFLGGKLTGKALFPIFRKGLEIVDIVMLGGLT